MEFISIVFRIIITCKLEAFSLESNAIFVLTERNAQFKQFAVLLDRALYAKPLYLQGIAHLDC